MMKRILSLLITAALAAAILGGCAKPASSETGMPSAPANTASPIPTTPPDVAETPPPAVDEDRNEMTLGEWTYYLDVDDAIVTDYGEDPPLHRKNASRDEDLGVRGFSFDIIGDYIYVDASYPDLDENGNQTWHTTRMGLDGTAQRRLEYGSMSARLVADGGQKFYFTAAGDSAIYVSDAACENVTPLMIVLPDAGELDKKLEASRDMQLDIEAVKDGRISFVVTCLTADGIQMYKGTYTMAQDGTDIKKTDGTYYDYEALESELD